MVTNDDDDIDYDEDDDDDDDGEDNENDRVGPQHVRLKVHGGFATLLAAATAATPLARHAWLKQSPTIRKSFTAQCHCRLIAQPAPAQPSCQVPVVVVVSPGPPQTRLA